MIPGIDLFNTIVANAHNDSSAAVKYEIAPTQVKSLKMRDHFHPWSITPGEFEYLRDFITAHNLRIGYECATAFGVSALAAAFGFRQTGGQ